MDDHKSLFPTSCSIYHQKYALLEVVRHMDKANFLKFCHAVEEVCPHISLLLEKGENII